MSSHTCWVALVLVTGCARDWDSFVLQDVTGASGGLGGGGAVPGGTGGTGGAPGGTGGGTGATGGAVGGTGGTVVVDCDNGVLDGTESDTDCGGSHCPPCVDGRTCRLDSDCLDRHCLGEICQPAACDDGRRNGNETDVDCGGLDCPACLPGDACVNHDDCASADRATGVCSNLICALECDVDWQDCDSLVAGCETQVTSDLANCSACGSPCDSANGTADCSDGVCRVTACSGTWADCSADENVSRDGCESDLTSTAAHCSACHTPCDIGATCRDGGCCNRAAIGEYVRLAVGTCFRVRPDRCDCDLNIQLNGGAGGVTMQVYWDRDGTSVQQTWASPGSVITMLPVSAFTAVVTSIDYPGQWQLNWWTGGCGGSLLPCFDSTD